MNSESLLLNNLLQDLTTGQCLRSSIFSKLKTILKEANGIKETQQRLQIQAACLDAAVEVENLIDQLALDSQLK